MSILSSARAGSRSAQPINIVLAGNPNAGKTTLFNYLTKSRLKTGNFHGVTTISHTKNVGGFAFTDSPGLYSFDAYTMEEGEAQNSIRAADVIINVVDSLTLQNSLRLTRKLISLNKNTVVYLTKTRALSARGGFVDASKLEKILGVPVYDCPPKQLKKLIAGGGLLRPPITGKSTFAEAYYGGNFTLRPHEKPFYSKIFAPLIFVATMVAAFFLTFYPTMPGALLKGAVEWIVCDKFAGFLSANMTNSAISSFFCDGVLGGVGGVLAFAPQLAILYLALILLDESGAMSALCFVTDGLFEKLHLSGRAAFSLISGLGCTAAAISTTRGFSGGGARRRTIAVLPYIPCGAKLPVFLTFLSPVFADPFPAVCALYFGGIAIALVLSLVAKGGGEGLVTEITPIALPSARAVKNKLSFQLISFIIKVTTTVAVFCMVSWVLSHVSFSLALCDPSQSILSHICRGVLPLFAPMGVTDWRLAYAFITGFAAKENIAASIAMLMGQVTLPLPAAAACCAFVLACPACISAYASSCREIGWKRTLLYNVAQLAGAFALAYATYFVINLIV